MIDNEDKDTHTPQAKSSLTDKKQDTSGSGGLIFVSAQPNQGEDGPQDLEVVLNTFFCHQNENENENDQNVIIDDPKVDELKDDENNNADVQEQKPEASDLKQTSTVEEQDPYATVGMTFMQRKLQRLQQEHLQAFKGSSLDTMIDAPRLSKLERERKQVAEKVAAQATDQDNSAVTSKDKKTQPVSFQQMSFDDAFASIKPRKSRLEKDKDEATALKESLNNDNNIKLQNSHAEQAQSLTVMKPKVVKKATDESVWGNVIKKRSRLEMDQDKAAAQAADEEEQDDLKKDGYALSKRRKVEQAEDYWKQFGNGDIFSQTIRKKSKLEQEKENANKARLKESERALKQDGSKKKGQVLII